MCCRSVHPDLRGVVVSTAVAEGGRAEYEAVKELYRKSDSAEQKIKYLTGQPATRRAFTSLYVIVSVPYL